MEIPHDLVKRHLESYASSCICGVQGRVIEESDRGSNPQTRFPWLYAPIEGNEGYHYFITLAGTITTIGSSNSWTVLAKEGNMSIKKVYLASDMIETRKSTIGLGTLLALRILSKYPHCRFVYNSEAAIRHLALPNGRSRPTGLVSSFRRGLDEVRLCHQLKDMLDPRVKERYIFFNSVYTLAVAMKNLGHRKNVRAEIGRITGILLGLFQSIIERFLR